LEYNDKNKRHRPLDCLVIKIIYFNYAEIIGVISFSTLVNIQNLAGCMGTQIDPKSSKVDICYLADYCLPNKLLVVITIKYLF